MTKEKTQYLIVTGNPVDGFFYYGPFADEDTTIEWANREQDGCDWWPTKLHAPEDSSYEL